MCCIVGIWQSSPDGRNMEVTTTLNRLYTDLDSLVNAGPGVVEQSLINKNSVPPL